MCEMQHFRADDRACSPLHHEGHVGGPSTERLGSVTHPTNALQLAELLDFRPDLGVIRLHDQRVVILSAAAVGLLRKDLIDSLGPDIARRLFLRFGYADGYHDAVNM